MCSKVETPKVQLLFQVLSLSCQCSQPKRGIPSHYSIPHLVTCTALALGFSSSCLDKANRGEAFCSSYMTDISG